MPSTFRRCETTIYTAAVHEDMSRFSIPRGADGLCHRDQLVAYFRRRASSRYTVGMDLAGRS